MFMQHYSQQPKSESSRVHQEMKGLWNAVVVQLPSHVRHSGTPWTAEHQTSLSLTISQSLPKFMSIASVIPSSHLILWCPLLLLPSILPSIRDFSNESSVHIRWTKHWSFSFKISPSNEYSGLISLKIDWFDLHAVQEFQESSLAPQFEGTNSLALYLLYNPALRTIQDHWEDHSLDKTEYPAIKRNELLKHATMWINLENMLREISQVTNGQIWYDSNLRI